MNELEKFSTQLIKQIKTNKISSNLYIKIWKGKDDILDNISGVSIVNDSGQVISHIQLIELECDENYIDLAIKIGQNVGKQLEAKNYNIEVINQIN